MIFTYIITYYQITTPITCSTISLYLPCDLNISESKNPTLNTSVGLGTSYKRTENIQCSKVLGCKIEILKRSMIIEMEHGSMLLTPACEMFGVDLHNIILHVLLFTRFQFSNFQTREWPCRLESLEYKF
ncbi:Hypothetical_protein [Hexamita inflata]|uniref:Hypothetical_protein n=1 Tax=Hexamita inflata TaxID=28002 RepID=A0AA86NNY9_9EUKA|nr:Hypothetical protein HINF_LOCUS10001 [Hexamita inflata]